MKYTAIFAAILAIPAAHSETIFLRCEMDGMVVSGDGYHSESDPYTRFVQLDLESNTFQFGRDGVWQGKSEPIEEVTEDTFVLRDWVNENISSSDTTSIDRLSGRIARYKRTSTGAMTTDDGNCSVTQNPNLRAQARKF